MWLARLVCLLNLDPSKGTDSSWITNLISGDPGLKKSHLAQLWASLPFSSSAKQRPGYHLWGLQSESESPIVGFPERREVGGITIFLGPTLAVEAVFLGLSFECQVW